MLLVTHEDFIASLEFQSVRDVAVALSGVAGKRDLITVGANKLRQRIAMLHIRIVAPDGILLGIGLRHLFGIKKRIEDSLEHRQWTRSDGAIVQIDLFARDDKLIAHCRPVGVLILVVKCRRGQGWRSSAGFREGIGLEGSKSTDTGKGREEMTAVK